MKTRLLFQGDSITDAGRDREKHSNNGRGYVQLITAKMGFEHARKPWCIKNRGISGNRTKDLLARWDEHCIELNPDHLSLYIGINNTWRRYDRDDPTSAEVFQAELHDLLTQVAEKTDCKLSESILIEPFVLDVPEGRKAEWAEDLVPKQDIVREAASTFGMRHLPLQTIFDEATNIAPATHWAKDGVHPTPAGHYLIALKWAEVMQDVIAP